MWEQNDRGAAAGTALVTSAQVAGPLFRQFGTGVDVSATDTLLYHSPGENAVDTNPTRVFPDMAQILANNTNAATGSCPTPPAAPTVVPIPTRECFAEFLPTNDWVGFLGDRTMNFRLTARDSKPGGGGDRLRLDQGDGREPREPVPGDVAGRPRRCSTAPRPRP